MGALRCPVNPPDYISYLGTIVENKNFRLADNPVEKLVVQIIGFEIPDNTYLLRILETGAWQSGRGLTKNRILKTIYHISDGREWWNLENDLPWICLELTPMPSFEHYR